MFNFDCITKGHIEEHNPNCPENNEKSGKKNALISPINHEPDIDKKVFYMQQIYMK